MGQKIHPNGLRVGIIRGWDSRWYSQKEYANWLREDIRIRDFITKFHKNAGVTKVEIERASKVHVIVNTAKPGLVIGKKGAGIDDLRSRLEKMTSKSVKISIQEINQHELEASLVAENIADALVKRVTFRRAMKQAAQRVMKAGAKGIRIQVSGRLGGSEIARTERTFNGKVPLHTLRADVDYSIKEANTTYGVIGVKVWIYRGDILSKR
ncbi:TPA: 30S ribosomal protein S3 [bacterium UBP9_UBA11836]|nr:30S ribosomal protein S3 [bacterium UBP9_UBA11836]